MLAVGLFWYSFKVMMQTCHSIPIPILVSAGTFKITDSGALFTKVKSKLWYLNSVALQVRAK